MTPKSRTTQQIIGMPLSGVKPKEISQTLNIAQLTVYWIKKKHDETGSIVDIERSGNDNDNLYS